MYKTTEYIREEFWGSVETTSITRVVEAHTGEAFNLFLRNTLKHGYTKAIEVKDDLDGEALDIYAEDYLSQEEISYLQQLEYKEFAKKSAVAIENLKRKAAISAYEEQLHAS